MKNLNQTKFAALIEVTKGYVTQLKKQGRVVMTDDGKLVDVEASLKLIQESADPNRDDVVARHAAERLAKNNKDKKLVQTAEDSPAADAQQAKFSEGRAKEQHFKALRAEMDYKKELGDLVSKEDMQMAVADLVMTFRQAVENVPHRLSSELVGKDVDFIRARLREDLSAALLELQSNCRKKLEVEN